jgi:chemotaxis signal transduction protein
MKSQNAEEVFNQKEIEKNYLEDLINVSAGNDEVYENQYDRVDDKLEVVHLSNDAEEESGVDTLMMDLVDDAGDEFKEEVVVLTAREKQVDGEDDDQQPLDPEAMIECQIVIVNGLKLALPTANIDSTMAWPKKVWPDADKHNLVIGLVAYKDAAVDLVPVSSLIHPSKKSTTTLKTIDGESKTIVILDNGETGLVCDGLAEIVRLDPKDICWRGADSKRLWLAGTAKKEGLGLLDTDGIMTMLMSE